MFEILTVGSFGAGLLLLSYNPWHLFWVVPFGVATAVGAYFCALDAKLDESQASQVEKPFATSDRYLINPTNLEKMIADGVPWDVVGVLTRVNCPPSSGDAKPTGLTEVKLIQELVALKCNLGRINEFRGKILKNSRVENTINPPSPSNTSPSDSEPAAHANVIEPSPVVRAPIELS